MDRHHVTTGRSVAIALALSVLCLLEGLLEAAPARAQTTTSQEAPIVYPQPQAQPQVVYVQQPYAQPGAPAPVPAGAPQTRSRPNLGLIISGAVMLGVGWVVSFIVGLPAGDDPFVSGSDDRWDAFRFSSLVPIAGPWIQLAVKPTDFREDYWGAWLIIDGLLQGAGAIMLIAGIATPSEETVYADLGGGVEIAIAPQIGPGFAGLALDGRF